ncbi:WD40-repeat-containing domain protein [Xylaria acuta]|nr:WD40-repeat-containing domain protein [Xylaria acuta]
MDDFDRDSNVSSDNEHEHDDDLIMHDVDAEEENDNPDPDAEEDDDNEPDNDNDNDEDEDDDQDHHHETDESQQQQQQQQQQQHEQQHGQQQMQQQPPRPASRKSATPGDQSTPRWQPTVRPEVFTAKTYDIVPTMAAPMATSINAIAVTPDLRYWMTGGSDGYIRKYDGPATINGKTLLTVAQRHPFVDSVTKAGVLLSYWENAEPQSSAMRQEDVVLSPVYSLAVHSQALWLLSGLESGGINLQSVRHDEGKRITCLQKHTNAVSALTLAADEKSVLSGSWDKNIFNWDLNTGAVSRQFDGRGGQISAIELRPTSGAPFPPEASEEILPSDTFSSTNGLPTATNDLDFKLEDGLGTGINGGDTNGLGVNGHAAPVGDVPQDVAGGQDSPAHDSLFGGSPGGGSDLFGDNDGMGAFGGDDDNEFSRAMMRDSAQDNMPMGDYNMSNATLNPENGPAPAVLPPPGSQQRGTDVPIDPSDSNMSGPDGVRANGAVSTTMPSTQEPVASMTDNSFSLEAPPLTQAGSSTGHEGEPPQSPSTVFAAPPATHHDTTQTSDSTFLSASIDGPIRIWDRRMPNPVARIGNRPGVPPWCMGTCWSPDGNWIYAGRRNGTVEEFSVQKARAGWQPERILKFPVGSGPVSCVRPMPNGRHLVCASHDILRLYDLHSDNASKHAPPPFLIIPGPPRAGVISSLYIDASSRFMISAAGNRGWEGSSTEVLIGYEINVP